MGNNGFHYYQLLMMIIDLPNLGEFPINKFNQRVE